MSSDTDSRSCERPKERDPSQEKKHKMKLDIINEEDSKLENQLTDRNKTDRIAVRRSPPKVENVIKEDVLDEHIGNNRKDKDEQFIMLLKAQKEMMDLELLIHKKR